MKQIPAALLALFLILPVLPALSEEPAPKAAAVDLLEEFVSKLEAKDYPAALKCLRLPPGMDEAKGLEVLPQFIERKEISAAGVAIIVKSGKFGKLAEVWNPERSKSLAEKAGVDLEQCYGLILDPAEVAFYWDGSKMQIIRCDDVGKLKQ